MRSRCLRCYMPSFVKIGPAVLENKIFEGFFTIYGHGGHLGHVTQMPWKNFRSPYPMRLHIKFDFDRPSGFREEDVWNCGRRRTDAGPWVYYKLAKSLWLRWAKNPHCSIFLQKSLYYQIWPCRKIGQGQHRVIIWTNYDGLAVSNATYQVLWKLVHRFHRRRFSKGFYHIWAWRPSWSCGQHHVIKFSFLVPERKFQNGPRSPGPKWFWSKMTRNQSHNRADTIKHDILIFYFP